MQSVVQDIDLGKRKRKKRQQVQIPGPDGEDSKHCQLLQMHEESSLTEVIHHKLPSVGN